MLPTQAVLDANNAFHPLHCIQRPSRAHMSQTLPSPGGPSIINDIYVFLAFLCIFFYFNIQKLHAHDKELICPLFRIINFQYFSTFPFLFLVFFFSPDAFKSRLHMLLKPLPPNMVTYFLRRFHTVSVQSSNPGNFAVKKGYFNVKVHMYANSPSSIVHTRQNVGTT